MNEITLAAPAKLNLTLDILRRRQDGYHDLKMVMISVELSDRVSVGLREDGALTVRAPGTDLPQDGDNLAGRAARAFFEEIGENPGADITIEKHIPSQAGMAGGSADAAATLRALQRLLRPEMTEETLEKLAERVGSDVPYCVRGGAALAEGRGERLTTLPVMPECYIVLCKPAFGLSTPALFSRVAVERIARRPSHEAMLAGLSGGSLAAVAASLCNVFEEVLLPEEAEEIGRIKRLMRRCGALGALMTGSGPTVFGLFQYPGGAQRACELLRRQYRDVFLTRPL